MDWKRWPELCPDRVTSSNTRGEGSLASPCLPRRSTDAGCSRVGSRSSAERGSGVRGDGCGAHIPPASLVTRSPGPARRPGWQAPLPCPGCRPPPPARRTKGSRPRMSRRRSACGSRPASGRGAGRAARRGRCRPGRRRRRRRWARSPRPAAARSAIGPYSTRDAWSKRTTSGCCSRCLWRSTAGIWMTLVLGSMPTTKMLRVEPSSGFFHSVCRA